MPLEPKPKHVCTIMSYSLTRTALAEITHRQIWQANSNQQPPYSFILSVDSEMRRAMMDIPPFFQPDEHTPVAPLNDTKALMFHYEKVCTLIALAVPDLLTSTDWSAIGYAWSNVAVASTLPFPRVYGPTVRIMTQLELTSDMHSRRSSVSERPERLCASCQQTMGPPHSSKNGGLRFSTVSLGSRSNLMR